MAIKTRQTDAEGVVNKNAPLTNEEVDINFVELQQSKVDKEVGKGLSTEDYTTAEKNKLSGIAEGAQVNVGTNLGQGGSGNSRTITSSTGNNVTVSTATTSNAGFMSTGDKSKLDGIAAGAQVNVATNLGSSGTGGTRTITSSTGSNTSITYTKADLGLSAVPNIDLRDYGIASFGNRITDLGITGGSLDLPCLFSSDNTGAPSGAARGGGIQVGWGGTERSQIYADPMNSRIWVRHRYSGSANVWKPWLEFYTTGNKPTAADVGAAPASHGHTWTNISGGSVNGWGGLRHSTAHGYIDFGPANTGHAHIYTDRPSFYFNKNLIVNGTTLTGNTGTVTSVSGGSGLTGTVTTSGSLAVDSTVIRTTGNQTIGGVKTFSSTIIGSISGNAATATALSQVYIAPRHAVGAYLYGFLNSGFVTAGSNVAGSSISGGAPGTWRNMGSTSISTGAGGLLIRVS